MPVSKHGYRCPQGPFSLMSTMESSETDYKGATDWSSFPPTKEHVCGTPARLEELYQKQLSNPGYQRFVESNVTIFGAFDDHDYGCDNGDVTYVYRRESAVAFVNFLGEPYESAMSRRARAGAGVYGVKLFDFAQPVGETEVHELEAGIDPDVIYMNESPFHTYSNQSVAVFVLDIRSHKTPWKTGSAAYAPDYEGDFLGEEQWRWLESALGRSQASVNVIVSGVQVHSNKFPDGNIAEAWGKYPRAQQRLFNAILQDGVQSPVLISGDVHMTQLSRKDCARRDSLHHRHISLRPLIEMTTSGMTHSWGTVPSRPLDEPDFQSSLLSHYKARVGSLLMHALHNLCSWKDVMTLPSTNGEAELQYSLEKNIGELEFHWEDRTIVMRTLGEDSAPLVQAIFDMDSLSGHTPTRNSFLSKSDFIEQMNAMHPSVNNDWVCINYRGRENNLANMAGHVATGFVLTVVTPLPCVVPLFCVMMALYYRGPSRRRKSSKFWLL